MQDYFGRQGEQARLSHNAQKKSREHLDKGVCKVFTSGVDQWKSRVGWHADWKHLMMGQWYRSILRYLSRFPRIQSLFVSYPPPFTETAILSGWGEDVSKSSCRKAQPLLVSIPCRNIQRSSSRYHFYLHYGSTLGTWHICAVPKQ